MKNKQEPKKVLTEEDIFNQKDIDAATDYINRETSKQETLEEAAEKEFPLLDTKWCRTGACEEENLHLLGHRRSFIKGAKWQRERSYSKEKLYSEIEWLIISWNNDGTKTAGHLTRQIIEQFKNK